MFLLFLQVSLCAMNLSLSTTFTESHRFWVVVFSFSFVFMHISISFLISSIICWLLRSMLFSFRQFSSAAQSCPTLCDTMDCSTPGLPIHHQFPEFTQTHVHCVDDAIQLSHPLSSPSPPAFNHSQHQGLFQWVGSSHQVAKVFHLQLQSFQWIFRTELL